MGKKISFVYGIFSLAIFITLIVLFGTRLGAVRRSNMESVSTDFDKVRRIVETVYLQRETFDSVLFRDTSDRIFRTFPDLDVLVVYSYDSGIQYLRARDSSLLAPDFGDIGAIKGVPRYSYNGFSRTKITSSITFPRRNSYIVEGVYKVIGEKELYPLLRDTVIILVVFAVFTAGLAILSRLFDRGSKGSAKPRMPPVPDAARHAEAPSPTCMFSPHSGLSWQAHLEKRLSLELERSAFNEQDLSLILVKVPGLTNGSENYRAIAREIQGKIAFEDLAFEYDSDGYAVILPNSNLDQSIVTLKNFLKTLTSGTKFLHDGPRCGLSSRNGRLVDGARLIAEAGMALGRTSSAESGRIVAFRPDPGKYRKYMSGMGAPVNQP